MTMLKKAQLEERRAAILNKISGIKSLRKGTINEQYISVKHKDGEDVKKGPYFIITKKGPGGKTETMSIPADKLAFFENEVANYKEFRVLADEYIQICEQISVLSEGDEPRDGERAKKNGKPLQSATWK
jgi:hypothetical protein